MEVSNKFEKKFAGSWSISGDRLSRIYPKKSISLKDNLRSIKVLSHNAAVTGSSGLTRAAAGAVLGFLVAGPVGTVLGAGAGAGGAKRGTLETYSVIISFKSAEVILGDVTAFELEALREYLPRLDDVPPAPTQPIVPAQSIAPGPSPNPTPKLTKGLSRLPPPIKGRKTKHMPMGPSPLLDWLGNPGESATLQKFRWYLSTALDSLNTIKWRHYDQEVDKAQEVIECILIAVSAIAGSIIDKNTEKEDRLTLLGYLSEGITEKQFDAAWSQPALSANINSVKAERIISATQIIDTKSTEETQNGKKGSLNTEKNISELEEKLATLKDLFDRNIIQESEYKVARAKALGI